MASTILTRFSAVALGFKEDLAEPKTSAENKRWALSVIKQLSTAILYAEELKEGPMEPASPSKLEALKLWIDRALMDQARAIVAKSIYSSPDVEGVVELRQIEKSTVILKRQKDGSVRVEGRSNLASASSSVSASSSMASVLEWSKVAASHANVEIMKNAIGGNCPSIAGWSAARGVPDAWVSIVEVYYKAAEEWALNPRARLGIMSSAAVAKGLYGESLGGAMAARLRLATIQLNDEASFEQLWGSKISAQSVELALQTPGAASLTAALLPTAKGEPLGEPTQLEQGSAGELKALLKNKFYLTDAGWKALVKKSEADSEFAPLLARFIAFEKKHEQAISTKPLAGERAPLKDGSMPTPGQSVLLGLCRCASMCAEQGHDLEAGLELIGAGLISGASQFDSEEDIGWADLLTKAPRNNRAALDKEQLLQRYERGEEGSKAAVAWVIGWEQREGESARKQRESWDAALARMGVAADSLLSPMAFKALSAAGWEPEGEDELAFAAMERDRVARFEKCPALLGALTKRKRELAQDPERYEREKGEVVDLLLSVEAGFWEQAPSKISWAWLKARSDEWHEHVVVAKASGKKWAPIQAGEIDLSSGWIGRELCSGGELHMEGAEMRHCVSSYAEVCASGGSRVFSLRCPDKKLKSTVEYHSLYPEGEAALESGADGAQEPRLKAPKELRLAQHRAFANSQPGLGAKLAEGRLLKMLAPICEAAWSPDAASPSISPKG